MKTSIVSLYEDELENRIVSAGFPKYRSAQIVNWLKKGVRDFDRMTNLPADLRSFLKENFSIYEPGIISSFVSSEDGTRKFLWKLEDGNAVETVLMRYKYGDSVCISTQVGCRQGCAFCASTLGGLVRDLDAGEMLDEVLFTVKESGGTLHSIVLMGIGEPLDNFGNVSRFLKRINSDKGMNLGSRHITLSTCGLIDRFDDLADLNMQFNLAISLHATDDETRKRIMPVANRFGFDDVIEAARNYFLKTGRRVTFEYALIKGVNDSPAQAEKLADIALYVQAHVNLIGLNYVEERALLPTDDKDIKIFYNILKNRNVPVSIRRKLGSDVNASCGQLRRSFAKEKSEVQQ